MVEIHNIQAHLLSIMSMQSLLKTYLPRRPGALIFLPFAYKFHGPKGIGLRICMDSDSFHGETKNRKTQELKIYAIRGMGTALKEDLENKKNIFNTLNLGTAFLQS